MHAAPRFAAGAPCWFELATTDQNAAKQFYSELFGWSADDTPIGNDEFYTMFRKAGKDVGAAYSLMPDMREAGIPPHWMIYFATQDADLAVAEARRLGATIRQPAFDVFDYGRMAVCEDPTGAVFSVWQAKNHKGAAAINEESAVCWTELVTRDIPAAREFYSNLFGWIVKPSAGMPTYFEFAAGGQFCGGLLPMDDEWEGIPPHWGIYFLVHDCDSSAARARELGGIARSGPFDAPGVGRIALMADPQGAHFSLITLQIAA
jgi:uncharacterized protein